jgi:UDP-glucose 4-epimerase
MPVSEISELNEAESPYAHTKQIGEAILEQYSKTAATFQTVALRYFNPVGAHKSGLIGESPVNPPTSLIPIITQTAIGIRPSMQVHGADYSTRDGSCIRDYIHVSDIGEAHVKALNYLINGESDLKYDVINLGTGSGVTVFEAIESFKENTGVNLNYNVGPRRNGDVTAIYSDTTKSEKLLNWKATTPLSEMVTSAWKWQQELNINNN